MAKYVIGDIQGCYDELQRLLETLRFDTARDTLWFTGDLVNRGPRSVEVLRFVKSLGVRAVTVLGNHDLHLLAVAEHPRLLRRHDTFQDVLNAPDRESLLDWLRHQPLLHIDEAARRVLVHAGFVPQWTVVQASLLAKEVEFVLDQDQRTEFFSQMYGDEPDMWDDTLSGWSRLRFITNVFTRIRYCNGKGKYILDAKGPLGTQPRGYVPWFEVPNRQWHDYTILFGHWAALGAAKQAENIYSLDSGCAWGGSLTALRLDSDQIEFTSHPCAGTPDKI